MYLAKLIHQSEKLTVYKTAFSRNLRDIALPLSNDEPFVLLDSAGEISPINRWSFLAVHPESIFEYKNNQLIRHSKFDIRNSREDPFSLLRDFFNDEKSTGWQSLNFSPYVGGPIGFISYDAARYIERLPSLALDDLKLPDFYFIKPKVVLAHNLLTDELFIYLFQFTRLPLAIEEITECLNLGVLSPAGFPPVHPTIGTVRAAREPSFRRHPSVLETNMSKEQFEEAVLKIKEYIYAGDVYQVNLSQRFEKDFKGSSFALYEHLVQLNPGPFCAYLKGGGFNLLCSSPERLASLNGKVAQSRPIAGTRRRGQNNTEDNFLSGHLLVDDKEGAEHIMLVDLERNDLGKVCDYNSVCVDELMRIERYSHVIHIVSNVKGALHKKRDAFDFIKAMFPGGTITGCPKVRCMEIIEELEPTKRAAYTGSLGYFSYNGNIDFNILIRTIVETNRRVFIQAGAGIVADSKPEREYYETISKAAALFKSLGHTFKEKKWEKIST